MLYLDGIKNTRHGHDATVSVWEDLSGNNYDFVPQNSGKMPTINSDSYSGFTDDTFLVNTSPALINAGNFNTQGTLEVCCRLEENGRGHIFGFPNQTGTTSPLSKLAVKTLAAYIFCARGTKTAAGRYHIVFQSASTYTASIVYGGTVSTTTAILNGTSFTETDFVEETERWDNAGQKVTLGNRLQSNNNTGYAILGQICSVRYYDRVLTASEQMHNLLVDSRKYGATVPSDLYPPYDEPYGEDSR